MIENSQQSKQLRLALDAAHSASRVIQSFDGNHLATEEKVVSNESFGLVTAADFASEKVIVDTIKASFPNDSIMSEESYVQADTTGNLWVIDPLDGTNNFANRIPHYSVSIAYCEQGVTQCGVIVNPATGEVCWAEQGRGAWLGDTRVHVNNHRTLAETIVVTGFYYDRGEMMKATLATMNDLFEQNVQGIRRFGSAALDLAYVGLGRFGAYFEYFLSPWDYAAGKLFVEEAGGKVSTCDGSKLNLEKNSILATNQLLHSDVCEITRRHLSSLEQDFG